MATTSIGANSQTIIDTILADVNAIVPTFSSLVNSYRLLVGSAEEIHRVAGVAPDVLARSVVRFDRTGELIDILIDLLCCKIAFSSDFLALTCGPVDLFRLLANRFDVADTPHLVAEEILLLEVLRRALDLTNRNAPCAPPCTPAGPPPVTFATTCFGPPPPPPPPPIPPEPPPEPPPPPAEAAKPAPEQSAPPADAAPPERLPEGPQAEETIPSPAPEPCPSATQAEPPAAVPETPPVTQPEHDLYYDPVANGRRPRRLRSPQAEN